MAEHILRARAFCTIRDLVPSMHWTVGPDQQRRLRGHPGMLRRFHRLKAKKKMAIAHFQSLCPHISFRFSVACVQLRPKAYIGTSSV